MAVFIKDRIFLIVCDKYPSANMSYSNAEYTSGLRNYMYKLLFLIKYHGHSLVTRITLGIVF
jgi:hypothetical protein